MAKIKNLQRIGQIARDLPLLEEARGALSDAASEVHVCLARNMSADGTEGRDCDITLPQDIKYNVVNILNIEINRLKEELADL